MFTLPPIRFSTKCKRCGLRYPRKEPKCIHCGDLDDIHMHKMLAHKRRAHKNTADIGLLFIYISLLIIVGLIIYALA